MRTTTRLLCTSVASALLASSAQASPTPADLVVTRAKVYTADATRTMAEAFAVRDGKVIFVGTSEQARELVGPQTKVKDLAGGLVLPGLIDSHIHPVVMLSGSRCDLDTAPKSLRAISEYIRGCIEQDKVPAGEWVHVRQWNYMNGNEPDETLTTLRQALDRASTAHPIQLIGADGHHSAYNSLALARAKNSAGKVIGYSKSTLAQDFKSLSHLIGVDAAGEPNGTVNDNARDIMGAPSVIELDVAYNMQAPERTQQALNRAGVTGILDAAVTPELVEFYKTLEQRGLLNMRVSMAQYYDPSQISTASGKPDYDKMVSEATAIRKQFANHPLLRADTVKLFADGVLEGNPLASPPTLPGAASLKPYLQPIFKKGKDGKLTVVDYVDTTSALCRDVRQDPDRYASPAAVSAFVTEHGYHPAQCRIQSGGLQHDREVTLEFVRRFHLAGFSLHIHALNDAGIRAALDAIEAARAADGISSQHDALAHLQVVDPSDVARIGRLKLYLAMTYSWAYVDPEADLTWIPFIDRVIGNDVAALHPANGYYEQNAYPSRSLKDAGGVLLGSSDAPVFKRDPQPFVNMATAVTRRLPGAAALNTRQSISIRDVLDAYTINGAQYMNRDSEAGSIEVGKSADFVLVDRDILALADGGKADAIRDTQVLETWFRGKAVYVRAGDVAASHARTSSN